MLTFIGIGIPVNIVLFEKDELSISLPFHDERAKHIRKILKLKPGESFRSGTVNGLQGHSILKEMVDKNLYLEHYHQNQNPPPFPIKLICGTPRPNSAKRMLRDATSMGVASITFVNSDLGEKSYRDSHVLKDEYVRGLLKQGAEQAYSSSLPEFARVDSLEQVISEVDDSYKICFDNVDHALSPSEMSMAQGSAVTCFIGSERGWSQRERQLFAEAKVHSFQLGPRVLRADTAFIAALSLTQFKMGLFD